MSEIEAQVVLDRMQNIFDQLPAAVSQAHERIIGEKRVTNKANGLIVDWDFIQEQAPGDNKLVAESDERLTKKYGTLNSYTADHGFDSPDNTACL